MELQLIQLFPEINKLHKKYGNKSLSPIYGAGCIDKPKICLVFMNPTSRNISAQPSWKGIKAPWLGTKQVWKMLFDLGLLTKKNIVNKTQRLKPSRWTEEFAEDLYTEISKESIYITNLAKCTQTNAKQLKNSVYKEYLTSTKKELDQLNPKIVITFGNLVSSLLLEKQISVSQYQNKEFEILKLEDKEIKIYPTYYPVGQGTPNLAKAKRRIQTILEETH